MAKSIDLATDASRPAALLLSYIPAVCAFVAPCRSGASPAIFDRLSHSRALNGVILGAVPVGTRLAMRVDHEQHSIARTALGPLHAGIFGDHCLLPRARYFSSRSVVALAGESSRARAAPLIARTQQPQQPRTAAAILARNPFDSLTGPLESLPPFSEPDGPINRDPLVAPECDSPLAVIVTESSAPACSLAALQTSADARPQNRRVGDTIAGKTVEFIGYNPQRGVPSVWLSSKKGLCQSPLFSSARYDDRDHRGGSAAQAGAPPGSEPSIDPAEIETVLRSRVRVVPEQKNGQIIGIRLFGIGSDSLLAMLGLKNGDRLESINGFLLGSPDQALTAYARLRSANHLDVKLNRGGRPMMLGYRMN